MASILYAWEFGSNLGHVGTFMPLTHALSGLVGGWREAMRLTGGQLDREALSSVNAVLTRHDCAQMQHLADLFDVAEEALITFPELDHYADRGPARYWGSLPSAGGGRLVSPEQPPGDLRAVLADLIDNPSWRANAQAFAGKYAAFDQKAVIGNLVRRIAEMLDGNEPAPSKGMP